MRRFTLSLFSFLLILFLVLTPCFALIPSISLASSPVRNIRVAISTNNFASLQHQKLVLTSPTGLKVLKNDQVVLRTNPNQKINLRVENFQIVLEVGSEVHRLGEIISLEAIDDQKITLVSLTRGDQNPFNPSYRGSIQIQIASRNTFLVINQLPIDQYLYQVLPSEMPIKFPMEALKAQAVAARTYAVRAMLMADEKEANFDLEDNTNSQMYNNRLEDERVSQAIDETSGLIMYSPLTNELVRAYYYSTSSGMTASSFQVWFDGKPVSYLQARSVTIPPLTLDMTVEENAKAFFTDPSIRGYDEVSPWFRWHFNLTGTELTEVINKNLPELYRVQPDFIVTKQRDGEFISQPIQSIGVVRDLKVIERGIGGNIMILEIVGTQATVRVGKELNIRRLITPTNTKIYNQAGEVEGYLLMPSSFFVFEIHREGEAIDYIVFHGGGSGHGVGMSQWGARGMAEAGLSFEEILKSFYAEIELLDIYAEENYFLWSESSKFGEMSY